jgi:uncharacterized protein YPO0396
MTDELWSTQWRLAHVELVNWGTFHGHHSVAVARRGHLVTGASGSGKSSMLDAIATVLTPGRWVTLNAAAQDAAAGRGDRTVASYVRGAWSKEADEFEDRTVSAYLRPAATWSGILLRYEDGEHDPITLVRLFHLKGTGTDQRSLSDMCVIVRGEPGLLEFQDYASRGIDARRLKADLDPVLVTTTGKHGPFFAKMRALLGISTENALRLLHKTQSAKNLGSLDSLFRKFMLEEPVTFSRAETAVEQFEELSDAYEHVIDLRKQADVLRLATDAAAVFDAATADADEATRLGDLVLPFAAGVKRDLAAKELHEAELALAAADTDAARATGAADDARDTWESARLLTNDAGGTEANHLRTRIEELRGRVGEVERDRERFSVRLRGAGMDVPGDAQDYAELVATARRELESDAPEHVDYDVYAAHSAARTKVEGLERERDELRHRRTNIDGDLLRVRKRIADELGVPETALPFGGELLEVRAEHAEWRGAIERVLSPVATALLVRETMLDAARRCVNQWHLGVRLVIEAVPPESAPPQRVADKRSIVHKVSVADGHFADYLHRRLGVDFDVACLEDPKEFDSVTRGVTKAGLYKRSAGRYEKNDRRRVDDRSAWVLGGDNEAKMEVLLESLGEAQRELEAAVHALEAATRNRDVEFARRQLFAEIIDTPYTRYDVDGAKATLARGEAQLESLVKPDSDLERAMARQEEAKAEYDALKKLEQAAAAVLAEARAQRNHLARLIEGLETTREPEVSEADAAQLEKRFAAVRRSRKLEDVDYTASQVTQKLAAEGRTAGTRVREAEAHFVEHATRYCSTWQSQASDLSPSIGDRHGFSGLLDGIVARGLPEHEANFLRLLKERSRDTLIYLRDEIMSAPERVKRRVDPVNTSLMRSRYDVGSHLQIRVKVRRSGEVQDFLSRLGSAVDGSFEDEGLAEGEARFAVLSGVMRRLGSSESADDAWKKRVLDTREHVSFLAHEISESGDTITVHDSSAGLSGGQRQKLVVFCLAAALRYQLATDDEDIPRYGTIVLDEAFDKADARYTRMAMDIFVEFGFHMVLATPQKLLQTLEPYIGAITSVSNPTRRSSTLARVDFDGDGQ